MGNYISYILAAGFIGFAVMLALPLFLDGGGLFIADLESKALSRIWGDPMALATFYASVFGSTGAIAGVLILTGWNRERDFRIDRKENRMIAAAMRGEISAISTRAFAVRQTIIDSVADKNDGDLVEINENHLQQVLDFTTIQSFKDRLGNLPDEVVVSVFRFNSVLTLTFGPVSQYSKRSVKAWNIMIAMLERLGVTAHATNAMLKRAANADRNFDYPKDYEAAALKLLNEGRVSEAVSKERIAPLDD